MRVIFCDRCGAPLDAPWAEIVVACRYCGAHSLPGGPGDAVPPYAPDDGRPRLQLGGRTYVVEGRLARGDSTDVYRARWAMRLGELVVVKVLRSLGDADLLRREWAMLGRLHESPAQGSAHFASRLPPPITLGTVRAGDHERLVAVYGWRSGFFHTLEEVVAAHPGGVDGRVLVWVLKRVLEVLAWTHRSGVVHGAVLPPHVLVHPRDHGAMLVGWGAATARSHGGGEPLPAISGAWDAFYPEEVRRTRAVSPATDVAMAARCVLAAARGGLPGRAGTLPGELGRLVLETAAGLHDDAWTLRERVDEAARRELGPPSYNPLPMPGW